MFTTSSFLASSSSAISFNFAALSLNLSISSFTFYFLLQRRQIRKNPHTISLPFYLLTFDEQASDNSLIPRG